MNLLVKLTPPAMTIEPQSKVIYVSLQLPEDFDRNRNYGAVVDYLLTYRPTWSNETKQVKCLLHVHVITKCCEIKQNLIGRIGIVTAIDQDNIEICFCVHSVWGQLTGEQSAEVTCQFIFFRSKTIVNQSINQCVCPNENFFFIHFFFTYKRNTGVSFFLMYSLQYIFKNYLISHPFPGYAFQWHRNSFNIFAKLCSLYDLYRHNESKTEFITNLEWSSRKSRENKTWW